MKKFALGIALAIASLGAFAGNSTGTVGHYIVHPPGVFFFEAGPTQGNPSCSQAGHWAVDLTGPNAVLGKAVMAAVMAASAGGKTIHVEGKNVCDAWGDRETVLFVVVY